jgi:RNA polymerase sigma-70 factor (ECF subfamily)
LNQLPTLQREAFVLQADCGLGLEEIATITGTSFETAKSRLRYARDKLKALLRDYA